MNLMQLVLPKGWLMDFAQADQPLLAKTIDGLAEALEMETPLVQCLTNNVTVQFVANAILAAGGAPAMVDIPQEAAAFAQVASAVYINVGTLHADQRDSMEEAARVAHERGVPWVLDPVAVGALPVRTALCLRLLEYGPTVIRGNASEIIALSGGTDSGRGVESGDAVDAARLAAQSLARDTGATVAVSGPRDLLTDGDATYRVGNGTAMFTRVTGAGCALGGVLAAAVGTPVNAPVLQTVVATVLKYTIAGERAAKLSRGPGSFSGEFLDQLSAITPAQILAEMRLS